MPLPFDLTTWGIAAVIVGFSYVIFGITAFGAAMFTVPFAMLGLWVGNRVHAGLSRESIQRIAAFLILSIGVSLLLRAILK